MIRGFIGRRRSPGLLAGGRSSAASAILLRVFCHAHGKKVVLLLAGYDKGKEPSDKRQNAEIKRAKQRLTRWKAEQDRSAKQARQIGGLRKRRGKRRP